MSRATLILNSKAERDRAMGWVANAPVGTRLDFKAPRRSLPQNDRLHAMLTRLAIKRPDLRGEPMTVDKWKLVFLHALGRELEALPALDGGWFPVGQRTRDLSVSECSDLMTLIQAYADREGIDLSDPADREAA